MAFFLEQLRYRWLRKYKSLAGRRLKRNAHRIVEQQWQQRNSAKTTAHSLPQKLMINLTSFPARFETLHLTLKSLLLQEVAADSVNLWLYQPNIDQLPQSVLELTEHGLTVHAVAQDTRSYKKLIPALQQYPDAFHITADDDIYYRPDWSKQLVQAFQGDLREILCWRAHYIAYHKDGRIKPYRTWQPKTEVRGPDPRLFFTSGGGVLFPPGSLDPQATNQELASKLAPFADDLWWYWMARLNGCSIRRVGDNPRLINWKNAREGSLWNFNKLDDGGNDTQLQNLQQHFGSFEEEKS